jgi:hypothetical protein
VGDSGWTVNPEIAVLMFPVSSRRCCSASQVGWDGSWLLYKPFAGGRWSFPCVAGGGAAGRAAQVDLEYG